MVAAAASGQRLIEEAVCAGLRSLPMGPSRCCHAFAGWGLGTAFTTTLYVGAALVFPGATLAGLAVIGNRQRNWRWWTAHAPCPQALALDPGRKAGDWPFCGLRHIVACHPATVGCGSAAFPVVTGENHQGGERAKGEWHFSSPPAPWAPPGAGSAIGPTAVSSRR